MQGDDREREPSAHRAELQASTAARNIAVRLDGGQIRPHRPGRNVYVLGLAPGYGLVEAGPVRAAASGRPVLKGLISARHLAQAGGAGILRRALPRIVLDGLRPAAWDGVPLADGVVDLGRPA